MIGVGKGVWVAVGGNHTIVGVIVSTIVGFSVGWMGVYVGLGVIEHAPNNNPTRQKYAMFFI
ncbi:MAG: hypothetical protein A2Y53_00435 [Chloroflexi bacterium RBG_16_47_49]|nr:MAG: hypothetical protein A2Y53_00435 [Chloroflexi bacterium RBG_16_47_49]